MMKLGTEAGLGSNQIVLDGSPQNGHSPQFLAHVRCGQTASWINIPLGTEVGLSLGDIVLDGDSALPRTGGTAAPHFAGMSLVTKRLDGSICHLVRR